MTAKRHLPRRISQREWIRFHLSFEAEATTSTRAQATSPSETLDAALTRIVQRFRDARATADRIDATFRERREMMNRHHEAAQAHAAALRNAAFALRQLHLEASWDAELETQPFAELSEFTVAQPGAIYRRLHGNHGSLVGLTNEIEAAAKRVADVASLLAPAPLSMGRPRDTLLDSVVVAVACACLSHGVLFTTGPKGSSARALTAVFDQLSWVPAMAAETLRHHLRFGKAVQEAARQPVAATSRVVEGRQGSTRGALVHGYVIRVNAERNSDSAAD